MEYFIIGFVVTLLFIFAIQIHTLRVEIDFLNKITEIPEGELERNNLINDVIYGTLAVGYFFTRENPLPDRVELLEKRLSKLEKHLKIKYIPKHEKDISAHYKKKK